MARVIFAAWQFGSSAALSWDATSLRRTRFRSESIFPGPTSRTIPVGESFTVRTSCERVSHSPAKNLEKLWPLLAAVCALVNRGD